MDRLNARAGELKSQSRYDEAEALYRQSLANTEATCGPNHPSLVLPLNDLAQLLFTLSRHDEAEVLFRRSLTICETFAGPDDPKIAVASNNLAELLMAMSRYDEAEALHRRSLAIFEAAYGPNDSQVARPLANLAKMLADQHRYDEAESHYQRSLAIKEASYGPDHIEVASPLLHLAALLLLQNRTDEAVPLLRRCLEIKKTAYGPDHPEVVHIVKLLGGTLELQGRSDEVTARPLGASHAGMLRRVGGKKYLDIDRAHAVVHACSTVEGYLDRCASGDGVIMGNLDREIDELTWFKDGTIGTSESRHTEKQECCYCGKTFRIRLRFPNTSARVRCSRCGRGQEFFVVQMTTGLEQALGMENRLGSGYSTIWLTVPLRHPEFSALLLRHGVVTWKSPHRLRLKRSGAQFQNTWQDILWFEGSKNTPWWPRYREKFGDVEILAET